MVAFLLASLKTTPGNTKKHTHTQKGAPGWRWSPGLSALLRFGASLRLGPVPRPGNVPRPKASNRSPSNIGVLLGKQMALVDA